MILPDSNVWISFFVEDDSNHLEAYRILDKQSKYYITEYVVLEVSTILSQKLGNLEAARIIKNLHTDPFVKHIETRLLFSKTLDFFINTKTKHKLSFIDISLLLLSDEYKIVSFDKELNKYLSRKAKNSGMN